MTPKWYSHAMGGGGRSRYSGNQAVARASLGRRASSISDVNGGSHAGRQDDARRHLIYMHADRDALGESADQDGGTR
jgi:hypothetical protein